MTVQSHVRSLVPLCVAGILAACLPAAAVDRVETAESGTGDLQGVSYSHGILALRYEENEIRLKFEETNPDIQAYELVDRSTGEVSGTVRYYSRDFYEKYGQSTGGTFVYSVGVPYSQISTDAANKFAKDGGPSRSISSDDLSFVNLVEHIKKFNDISQSRPLCVGADAETLLSSVVSGQCYVVCSGISQITAGLAGNESRIVLLYGRQDILESEQQFLWSEWHTTTEFRLGDGWYWSCPYLTGQSAIEFVPR